jgi:peptidyl-prolyl cis-trans isomerase-like protein 2
MYDDISRERKDKNRAKQRAYVRMVTNMGGSLNLELFCEKVKECGHVCQRLDVDIARFYKQAPKTCYNFLMLARQGKYNDCAFHRLIPGFMVNIRHRCHL